MHTTLKCTDMERLLDDYVDKKLSIEMDLEFQDHLMDCDDCFRRLKVRRTYDDLRNIMGPASSATSENPKRQQTGTTCGRVSHSKFGI